MPGIRKHRCCLRIGVSVGRRADGRRTSRSYSAIRAKIVDQQVEVGGPTATLIDTSAAISDRLPLAILLIALATFVLLFLFTGSIVVPLKALVLNLLMLSAVLGTMVWIFQDGHLASATRRHSRAAEPVHGRLAVLHRVQPVGRL